MDPTPSRPRRLCAERSRADHRCSPCREVPFLRGVPLKVLGRCHPSAQGYSAPQLTTVELEVPASHVGSPSIDAIDAVGAFLDPYDQDS
jgi:hypothetical protein